MFIKKNVKTINFAKKWTDIFEKMKNNASENVIEDLTELNIKQEVSIKGRIIGYDDLLEELKLDKTIIINTKK